MLAPTIAPTQDTLTQGFALDITKVAVIADFEGPLHRYVVRNWTLVSKTAL